MTVLKVLKLPYWSPWPFATQFETFHRPAIQHWTLFLDHSIIWYKDILTKQHYCIVRNQNELNQALQNTIQKSLNCVNEVFLKLKLLTCKETLLSYVMCVLLQHLARFCNSRQISYFSLQSYNIVLQQLPCSVNLSRSIN